MDNYANLQTTVAEWLWRADLTARIPDFIRLAEAGFNKDENVRLHVDGDLFVIEEDGDVLPAALQHIEGWYHDGDTHVHPIEVVGTGQIANLKRVYGTVGVPRFAALVGREVRYAPSPDGEYSTRLTYWSGVPPLSDAEPVNWLLEEHPDVYLYGALVHSAPFLKDDERIPLWRELLGEALEQLHGHTDRQQFGGPLRRPLRRPIG